jgi:hypothetical protein
MEENRIRHPEKRHYPARKLCTSFGLCYSGMNPILSKDHGNSLQKDILEDIFVYLE